MGTRRLSAEAAEGRWSRCSSGDDLSRENVMRQAANLKDLELPMLLPGVKVNTSPENYSPIRQEALFQFNGESFEQFSELYQG